MAKIKDAIEARFRDTTSAVEKLRARGGKIVFVRLPHSGGLKALEDRTTPRSQIWDPLLQRTAVPGIYYEDFPELSGFNCPEWSHLSAGDSVEFSKRLVPICAPRFRCNAHCQRTLDLNHFLNISPVY